MARAQLREPHSEDAETQTAPEEPETQEAPAEGQDSPVLDLTDAAVKRLIRAAKQRGYVTLDELNSVLPSEETSPEQIEDIMAMLNDMGITVVESEEEAEPAAKAPTAAAAEEAEPAAEDLPTKVEDEKVP